MSRLLTLTGFGYLFAVMVSSATALGALAVTPPSDRRVAILYKAPTAPHDAGNDGGSPGPGGGSRSGGNCAATPIALTAIVPEPKGFGQTTSSRPTVWIYVPYTLNDNYQATLMVQDRSKPEPESTLVSLPDKPGIIGIPLPSKIPALALNQVYQWSFQVNCGQKTDTVSGLIQRVTLPSSVQKQLEQVSPQQKATVYAANGVWYDALSALGTVLQTKAGDTVATADWVSLLTQAKAESTAAATNWASLLKQIESKDVTVQTIEP